MKKKKVWLLLSLVLLAAMGVVYFKVKNLSENEQSEALETAGAQEEKTKVFSFENGSIQGVKFLVDGTKVSFVKEDEIWKKEDEPEFPLDQEVIESAVSSVEGAEADYVIEEAKDLSEYDLQEAINVITLLDENGVETELQVGLKNQDGQYYVRRTDGEKVYLVNENVIDPFMKNLYNYSKMNELPILETNLIDRIKVEKANAGYELQKKENSTWYVKGEGDETGNEKADATKINDLLYKIAALSYESLVDYHCENPADYGLEEPYAVISIDYQTEEMEGAEESQESQESYAETSTANHLDDTVSEENALKEESVKGDATSEENASKEESVKGDTTSGESASVKKTLVHQKLVLYVGGFAANGGRYVKTEGSREVYTMPESMLESLLEATAEDYWNLSVFYLSINELSTLKVNYDGETNICNVSRETLQEENGEETEKNRYFMDNIEVDYLEFSSFYNKLVDFRASDRLTEAPKAEKTPYFTAEFTELNGNIEKVEIFPFDEDYHIISINERYYLVNKMSVKQMTDAFKVIRDGKDE